MSITVTEDDAGRRLEAFLRSRLAVPRPLVMKLVRTGRVRVNGKRSKIDARLAEGDVVDLDDPRLEFASVAPTLTKPPDGPQARAVPGSDPASQPRADKDHAAPRYDPARIRYEDADLLVYDKPPGLAAHAGSGHAAGLIDALRAHPGVGERAALANRLDRDTSGLVILAKGGLALRGLHATIRAGGLEKSYLALVRGAPAADEGVVEAALRKDRELDGLERMVVVEPGAPGALAARTAWRVERRLATATLLELRPETGRQHQLRAHCAHLGHPIALDRRYGDREFDAAIEEATGLRRLFLHASRLAFPAPRTGARVVAEAPLAEDLAAALARLAGEK